MVKSSVLPRFETPRVSWLSAKMRLIIVNSISSVHLVNMFSRFFSLCWTNTCYHSRLPVTSWWLCLNACLWSRYHYQDIFNNTYLKILRYLQMYLCFILCPGIAMWYDAKIDQVRLQFPRKWPFNLWEGGGGSILVGFFVLIFYHVHRQ
jgi:hypothetical protein